MADTKKPAAKKAAASKSTKAETNAKAAAKATATKATSKASTSSKPAAKKAATPARRAVARPVTRVARPAPERAAARAAAPEKREPREKPTTKPLPTAPAGHAPLIGADGVANGSIELPASLAATAKNGIATLFQAFMAQRANARQGNAATKNRARVSGGGAKPWRQKGTGRARQGSTRSPHWRHGGVVFGPNGRKYDQRMPEKMRKAAFGQAMSVRAAEGRVFVLEGLTLDGERPRTRDVVQWLGKIGDTGSTLFVWSEIDEGAARAMANLPDVESRTPGSLRLSDVLEADTLLVMRPALDALAARAGENGLGPVEPVLAPTDGAGAAGAGSRG
ncbi:MAG TPA: 50S ribosomal protein L4 [Candidatus Limnocylindrales bacterium]|nr:50S ribosomal protein L4 [Candidatus Limnocylindrales bacterium]